MACNACLSFNLIFTFFKNLFAASVLTSGDLVPVITIFPALNIRAVALGSLDLIMRAGNLSMINNYQLGSYSVLLQSLQILIRSISGF